MAGSPQGHRDCHIAGERPAASCETKGTYGPTDFFVRRIGGNDSRSGSAKRKRPPEGRQRSKQILNCTNCRGQTTSTESAVLN